jgi:hypothetical protein
VALIGHEARWRGPSMLVRDWAHGVGRWRGRPRREVTRTAGDGWLEPGSVGKLDLGFQSWPGYLCTAGPNLPCPKPSSTNQTHIFWPKSAVATCRVQPNTPLVIKSIHRWISNVDKWIKGCVLATNTTRYISYPTTL